MSRNSKRKQEEINSIEESSDCSPSQSPEAKKTFSGPSPTEDKENNSNSGTMSSCLVCAEKDDLITQLKETISTRNSKIEDLNMKIAEKDRIIADQDQAIVKLEARCAARMSSSKAMAPPDMSLLIKSTVTDLLDRRECAKALVVSGLPELSQDPSDDVAHDELLGAQELVKKCGGDPATVKEVHRMGRILSTQEALQHGLKPKPFRLLKIELSSPYAQQVVVQNARCLRDSPDFKTVYVNPSRPKEDRIKIAELQKEMARRREDGGRYFIDYRALVIKEDKRPPKPPIQDVPGFNL